jgi:type VI protein secretion system component Hcp
MAGKKQSGSKKPARKKKGDLNDLSQSGQELSEEQARAIRGGKRVKGSEFLKIALKDVLVSSYSSHGPHGGELLQ